MREEESRRRGAAFRALFEAFWRTRMPRGPTQEVRIARCRLISCILIRSRGFRGALDLEAYHGQVFLAHAALQEPISHWIFFFWRRVRVDFMRCLFIFVFLV